MLEKAIATTRRGQYTHVQYARFADDLVLLVASHPRHDWLVKAVERRLREEVAKLRVEINEDKSRTVDLSKGEKFSFLGFEFRRILSRNQKWRAHFAPKLKKRTALFAKLREIFRRYSSQPVDRVIELINPILRGWVNYFAVRRKPPSGTPETDSVYEYWNIDRAKRDFVAKEDLNQAVA
jgi:RNA-directed DNA polymerase